MKKFVILLLLLIPLIVIFTLTASAKIISAEVAIGIEHFELLHMGEPVTEATINLGEYKKKKLRYQLIPRYYPVVADVSGFKWVSDNPQVATVDEKGIVTFLDCGFAKITAISLDSSSVRASCSFFVEDDTIHSLSVFSYLTNDTLSAIDLSLYDVEQIRVDVSPYKALVGDVTYLSSDESVFTCSQIGVLTAKKEGNAALTVRALDLTGKQRELTLPVRVSGKAIVKKKKVYAYGDGTLDLTPYLSESTLEGGGTSIDLSSLSEGEARAYKVKAGEKEDVIEVLRLPFERMLGFADMDVLLANAWKEGVYLAEGRKMTLTPIDLVTALPVEGVEIRSANNEILSVANGEIKALRAGETTLTFSKTGYEPYVLSVQVATPISYFSLNLDPDNDAVGLGSERVFGTKSIYEGRITDGIRIYPENIYPATGIKLFSYETQSEYASVDDDGFLTFREDAVGKTVTVTVRSIFSTNAIARSYTFKHIVEGINVGFEYGANAFDAEKNEKPSFAPYYEAVSTMYEDRSYALVFQTNIYMPTREEVDSIEGEYHKICFIRDLYGNGYKLDGQFYQYEFESKLFEEGDDEQLKDHPEQKGVKIVDLFVNSYAPIGDNAKGNFDALMEKGGTPIRTYYKERTDFEIAFSRCVFQYAYIHVIGIGGTLSFDGCIFRNSAGVSFLIESLHQQETYFSVNNCIFSNSISMTGLISNGTLPLDAGEYGNVHYNALRWTGTNYIYNWLNCDKVGIQLLL